MPYSEAVRPTRLGLVLASTRGETSRRGFSQRNFSTVRYEHRRERLDGDGRGRAVAERVGGQELAGEVRGLSDGAHGHGGVQANADEALQTDCVRFACRCSTPSTTGRCLGLAKAAASRVLCDALGARKRRVDGRWGAQRQTRGNASRRHPVHESSQPIGVCIACLGQHSTSFSSSGTGVAVVRLAQAASAYVPRCALAASRPPPHVLPSTSYPRPSYSSPPRRATRTCCVCPCSQCGACALSPRRNHERLRRRLRR
jgi:hypothetical protein